MLSGVNDKGVFFTALALKITKLRIFNHFINKILGHYGLSEILPSVGFTGLIIFCTHLYSFIHSEKCELIKYKSLSWLDTNLWKAVSVSDLVSDCRSIWLLSELLSSEREKLWLVQSLLQLHPGKQSGNSGALKYITRQGHISSSSDGTCWSSVEYVISDKQVIRD